MDGVIPHYVFAILTTSKNTYINNNYSDEEMATIDIFKNILFDKI